MEWNLMVDCRTIRWSPAAPQADSPSRECMPNVFKEVIMSEKHKIVIVGGGFAGLYAALELEKSFATRDNVEITLINKENFFLFTPMLHEIAAGDLDLTNIVNPIRKLLRNVAFFEGQVQEIDLRKRRVVVGHGF